MSRPPANYVVKPDTVPATHRLRGQLIFRVSFRISRQFADELTGGVVEDADVEVFDEDDHVVAAAQAWPAVVARGHGTGGVESVVARIPLGVMVIRIYPNELFPTEFRATAVGISTSVSRFGAAPERTGCHCTDITPSSRRFGRFPASLGG